MHFWAYLYFAALILFSLFIFTNWTFMLVVWIGLIVVFYKKARLLPPGLKKLFQIVIFGYPLVASIIKFMIEKDIIKYSWFWLNRFEHFFWAFSMTIVLFPITYPFRKILNKKWLLLIQGCITITLGNVIELIEFAMRQSLTDTRLGLYYSDTMLDLVMNFSGVTIALITACFLFKKEA
jgi:hypothetical protein